MKKWLIPVISIFVVALIVCVVLLYKKNHALKSKEVNEVTVEATPTEQPSNTGIPSNTIAATSTPTSTSTPTPEPSDTPTPTNEPTNTPTVVPTATPVPTKEATPKITASPTPTSMPTNSPTVTPTFTPMPTATSIPTPTVTPTPTPEPTKAPTPIPTPKGEKMTTFDGVLVPYPNLLAYEAVVITKERTESSVKAEVTLYIIEGQYTNHPWSYWLELRGLPLNIVACGEWAEDCGEKGRIRSGTHKTYKYDITPESTTITIPVHVYATDYNRAIVPPEKEGFDLYWNLEVQLPELE